MESSRRYQGGASEGSLWWQDSNGEDRGPSRRSSSADSSRGQPPGPGYASPGNNNQLRLSGRGNQHYKNASTDGKYHFDPLQKDMSSSSINHPSEQFPPRSSQARNQQPEHEPPYIPPQQLVPILDIKTNPQLQELAQTPNDRQYGDDQRYDQNIPYSEYATLYHEDGLVAELRGNQQLRRESSSLEKAPTWGSVEERVLKLRDVFSGRRSKRG